MVAVAGWVVGFHTVHGLGVHRDGSASARGQVNDFSTTGFAVGQRDPTAALICLFRFQLGRPIIERVQGWVSDNMTHGAYMLKW